MIFFRTTKFWKAFYFQHLFVHILKKSLNLQISYNFNVIYFQSYPTVVVFLFFYFFVYNKYINIIENNWSMNSKLTLYSQDGYKQIEEEDVKQLEQEKHDQFDKQLILATGQTPEGNEQKAEGYRIVDQQVNNHNKSENKKEESDQQSNENEDETFRIFLQFIKYPEFAKVFMEKMGRFIKNNNVPKKLLKGIVKGYNKKQGWFFECDNQILNQIDYFMKKQKKIYGNRQNKNWNNSLASMNSFFSQDPMSHNPKQRSFVMRKMAHSMIRSKIIPSVHFNKRIQMMKKSYLLTLKIQMLRTRNPILMSRTQTH